LVLLPAASNWALRGFFKEGTLSLFSNSVVTSTPIRC
jgi:hypothetical protein